MDSEPVPKPSDLIDHRKWLVQLFERYHRPLVAYAAQLLSGNIEAARDCVQETFLSLCKQPLARLRTMRKRGYSNHVAIERSTT